MQSPYQLAKFLIAATSGLPIETDTEVSLK